MHNSLHIRDLLKRTNNKASGMRPERRRIPPRPWRRGLRQPPFFPSFLFLPFFFATSLNLPMLVVAATVHDRLIGSPRTHTTRYVRAVSSAGK